MEKSYMNEYMSNFNIEKLRDYTKVGIASYVAAEKNIENAIWDAIKHGDLRAARSFSLIYKEVSKLHAKRNKYWRKNNSEDFGRHR